jgi:hypothetical protein
MQAAARVLARRFQNPWRVWGSFRSSRRGSGFEGGRLEKSWRRVAISEKYGRLFLYDPATFVALPEKVAGSGVRGFFEQSRDS